VPAPSPTPQQGRSGCSLYEQACRKRGILPKFIRAVHDGCVGKELDLSGLSLGDLQLEALLCDTGLVPVGKVHRWKLRGTRITAVGLACLTRMLPWETELLDLARNDVGLRGVNALSAKMGEGLLPRLRSLDLSGCGMGCAGVASLCNGTEQCPFLLRLELNHNTLKDGMALGNMIASHTHITRLALNSNFLTGQGVASLFRGVLENSKEGGQLADIDLAWNGFGNSNALGAAVAISKVLAESATLYHLDLSYNGLDAASCATIGEGLKDNHYLYGLHLVGNSATMDADGFLRPLHGSSGRLSPPHEEPPSPVFSGDPRNSTTNCLASRRPALGKHGCCGSGSLAPLSSTSASSQSSTGAACSDDDVLRERDVLEQRSTCWACEGWTRVDLEWPLLPDEKEPRSVWAFTSLDGFRSGLQLRRAEEGPPRFCVARMVPGGCKLRVVFQVDQSLKLAPGIAFEPLETPTDIRLRQCEKMLGLQRQKSFVKLAEVNVVDCPIQRQPRPEDGILHGRRTVLLDGPDGAPVQMLRITETEFKMQEKRPRSAAFFAGFQKETDALLRECLEVDWSKAKVGRIVDEQEWQHVQAVLQDNYRHVIAVYRWLSTLGVSGETAFGVNQIEAADIISKAGLMDTKVTRIADLDRLFIAAKVTNVEMKRGVAVRNDKALTRHQFLEFLLRVAQQRFVQPGETTSIADAVCQVLKALSGTSGTLIKDLDSLMEALHTDSVDDVYKDHLCTLQAVYKAYSGRKAGPGIGNFMSFGEFQDLLEQIDAYDLEFPRQRAGLAFRLGMMTQAEESYASRFQEMTFIEFQHALGAVVSLRANFQYNRMAELVNIFFTKHLFRAVPLHAAKA